MTTYLTSNEIQEVQQIVQNYDAPEVSDIETAIATLEKNDGDLDASFNELWAEQVGSLGGTFAPEDKSLWQVTLKVLREETCGNEGFRDKVAAYTKNPTDAPLLTGLIVYLATLTTLPINPAIATIVVLYILKVGLNIFCEYIEPPKTDTPS